MAQARRDTREMRTDVVPARNAWHLAAITWILLSGVVTAEQHGHRPRGPRPGQRTEDVVERDRGPEDELELTAQKELRSFSKWKVEHSYDDIAIWRPEGGANSLCPPPSLHHIEPALCDHPLCNDDVDCASGRETEASGARDNETSSYACCYNGCVNTCTKKLEPPIAFDWLEEFRANEGRTDKTSGVRQGASGVPVQLRTRTIPEAITFPGGCVLTANQYMELEGFRRNAHINKCFCDKGGISCEVSQVNLS
ncbi:uncharacterized protein LOC110826984 [Zootermopsis nevadensis]|uniref:uncharacterized protein LOC110826984 n=1 Tax=Zootermopsis nevadensis TaxID=136037 RepID=UPI000B8E9A1B|nr:uncharacterized protein LOC110826984 [Zootermopsis nevadensis]